MVQVGPGKRVGFYWGSGQREIYARLLKGCTRQEGGIKLGQRPAHKIYAAIERRPHWSSPGAAMYVALCGAIKRRGELKHMPPDILRMLWALAQAPEVTI